MAFGWATREIAWTALLSKNLSFVTNALTHASATTAVFARIAFRAPNASFAMTAKAAATALAA